MCSFSIGGVLESKITFCTGGEVFRFSFLFPISVWCNSRYFAGGCSKRNSRRCKGGIRFPFLDKGKFYHIFVLDIGRRVD